MMALKARYMGHGEHYMNIPDRDLTDDDWERMTDEQRDLVKASTFYEMGAKPAPPKASTPVLDLIAPADAADMGDKEGSKKK